MRASPCGFSPGVGAAARASSSCSTRVRSSRSSSAISANRACSTSARRWLVLDAGVALRAAARVERSLRSLPMVPDMQTPQRRVRGQRGEQENPSTHANRMPAPSTDRAWDDGNAVGAWRSPPQRSTIGGERDAMVRPTQCVAASVGPDASHPDGRRAARRAADAATGRWRACSARRSCSRARASRELQEIAHDQRSSVARSRGSGRPGRGR
jgi:hypothetical protein